MSTNISRNPTGPTGPSAAVVRTEVGNGRGSLIIGLTVVAIALFAVVTVLTPFPAHAMAWFAPTALITAGVFGLVQRR
jgi:hypothetical protein